MSRRLPQEVAAAPGGGFVVWDLPLRLFHWSLPLLVTAAWATRWWGDPQLLQHRWCGYLLLVALLFRLAWGVAGGRTARFTAFIAGPRAVVDYIRDGFPQSDGHNPLGGWAVLALLSLLSAQAISGLFADDGLIAHGPWAMSLSEDDRAWATSLHVALYDILLVMVGLHLAAVAVHRLTGEREIVRAMVTGRRRHPSTPTAATRYSPWLATALVALSALCVWAAITLI